MSSFRFMVLLGVCLLALVSAQITFSRDWTGGKRAESRMSRPAFDCNQFARLCRHFVAEMEQAFTAEMRKNKYETEKTILYDDE